MRLAALQFDVSRDSNHNLNTVTRWLREAHERGIQLVLLPEMWATSFPRGQAAIPAALEATARAQAGLADLSLELDLIIAGTAFGEPEDGALPPNRFFVIERGQCVLSYDKVHLFSPTAEGEIFCAGNSPPPTVETSVGRVCGVTCYDLRFPEICRVAFHDEADLMLVPAQWPAPRAAHWNVLCAGRAVENQCHVLACNRTGVEKVGRRELELVFPGNSLVIDPNGAVLAVGDGREGLVVADVDWEEARRLRRRVPIQKDVRTGLYDDWNSQKE